MSDATIEMIAETGRLRATDQRVDFGDRHRCGGQADHQHRNVGLGTLHVFDHRVPRLARRAAPGPLGTGGGAFAAAVDETELGHDNCTI